MAEADPLVRDWGLCDFMNKRLEPSALLNRKSISIITILLTYRCPAACDHCVFESSPKNKTQLDMEVAYKLVEAASRQSPPPVLGFSGGEPFLRLDEMRDLARFAAARGMPSEVISSSAWAKSREHAAEILGELKSIGFQSYATSVDRFHTPFVKPDKMRWAMLGALDAGLRGIINVQISAGTHLTSPDAVKQDVADLLSLPRDEVERFQINPLITTPVGRARANIDSFHIDPTKDMSEGCPMATEVVTLSPLGLLYPCCGMVVGEKPETADLFIQDSLKERTVDEIAAILEDMKGDLFFKLLQAAGPFQILQELKRRNPALAVKDSYTGACDACLEFTSRPDVAAEARQYLGEMAERIALLEAE